MGECKSTWLNREKTKILGASKGHCPRLLSLHATGFAAPCSDSVHLQNSPLVQAGSRVSGDNCRALQNVIIADESFKPWMNASHLKLSWTFPSCTSLLVPSFFMFVALSFFQFLPKTYVLEETGPKKVYHRLNRLRKVLPRTLTSTYQVVSIFHVCRPGLSAGTKRMDRFLKKLQSDPSLLKKDGRAVGSRKVGREKVLLWLQYVSINWDQLGLFEIGHPSRHPRDPWLRKMIIIEFRVIILGYPLCFVPIYHNT